MCGIFGQLSDSGVSREELERMARTLAHRGPDDLGVHVDGPAGLGNRRLSIIDLDGGHQPISNEDGTIWVAFNGEIYNYRAMRRELERRGHRFKTSSDTEVIVHLYEDEGSECVQQLEGMFAFAIWDRLRGRMVLARDRFGQKPLYYHHRPGRFVFASEIKAILASGTVAPEPNPVALHHYLSLRFVPPPDTMFQGIRKVPAAHSLVLERDQVSLKSYWSLRYAPKVTISDGEALATFDELLGEAVESHLVSDVPVGALLSGGLDSGLIAALMSVRTGSRISTFSVGVTEKDWSELPAAGAVAKRYGTDHHEIVVEPNLLEILPALIWHLDEPSDPSAACKYFVARAAARHVKVVLGGDGGDEMLGGYDRYVGNKVARYYSALPKVLRHQIATRLLRWVPDTYTYKSLAQKLRWLNQMADDSEDRRYAASVNFFRFDDQIKDRLYTPVLREKVGEVDSIDYIASVFRSAPVDDLIDRMLYTDVMTQLAEHGCMIVDRTTMAFSLESRSPFLDRKLAEFCAVLPTHLKIRGRRLRWLERELARKYLPPEVVRRRKQGFGLPLGYWFKGELGAMAEKMFRDSALAEAGCFDRDGLLTVLDEHRTSGIDHSHRLWMLLNLEMWYRIFIENQGLGEIVERAPIHGDSPVRSSQVELNSSCP